MCSLTRLPHRSLWPRLPANGLPRILSGLLSPLSGWLLLRRARRRLTLRRSRLPSTLLPRRLLTGVLRRRRRRWGRGLSRRARRGRFPGRSFAGLLGHARAVHICRIHLFKRSTLWPKIAVVI